jgi:iron(III) transport system ATP-binding protein
MTAMLELDAIQVGYPTRNGPLMVVRDLSISLEAGEIGCLLGASGCGKTTALRAVAGFEPLRGGRIILNGTEIASERGGLPPERRRIGMMFQDYALFPHLTVAENVSFGLRGWPRDEQRKRVAEMLELVGLSDGGAYPHELSGGQQQRVALARALAPDPPLLLLDEPFSNLDVYTRERLASELRQILRAAGATVLLVTHDQTEAFALSDRIGVMREGRILQWDSAANLYRRPLDRYVADFLGRGAVVSGSGLGLPAETDALVRPTDLCHDPDGPIEGCLLTCAFRGPGFACTIRLRSGDTAEVDLPPDLEVAPGEELRFRLTTEDLPRFPR